MRIPSLNHCIVCEDVRLEVGNKATLLGFHGILPHVKINMISPQMPGRLMLVLLFGPGEGTTNLQTRIFDPKGKALFQSPEINYSFNPKASNNAVGIGLFDLGFSDAGKYGVQILARGAEVFRSSFMVDFGPAPVFT